VNDDERAAWGRVYDPPQPHSRDDMLASLLRQCSYCLHTHRTVRALYDHRCYIFESLTGRMYPYGGPRGEHVLPTTDEIEFLDYQRSLAERKESVAYRREDEDDDGE